MGVGVGGRWDCAKNKENKQENNSTKIKLNIVYTLFDHNFCLTVKYSWNVMLKTA